MTGRVLVSANAFRILLTRAWNLSAFRSLLYFPFSRIIRKQGANFGVHTDTLLYHLEEAKSLLSKVMPVARRALGESHEVTLRMRWNYAAALVHVDGSTLDDLRESVTTLEDAERTARRVLGGAHPITKGIEQDIRRGRAALHARETPSPRSA